MTPIFEVDFSAVESSIPVYEKGRYRVQVKSKTPFIKEGKERDKEGKETGKIIIQSGMRYNLEMVGMIDDTGKLITKDYKGRAVSSYTIWGHTEGGWKYGKPFLMAANGYDRKDEQKANEKFFQKHKWFVKGEVGDAAENIETGDGWDTPVGKVLDVTLDKDVQHGTGPNEGKVYENQDFNAWTPYKG